MLGSKIDHGNRVLTLDLVPRDENGVPVTPKTAGVMHLYKMVGAAWDQGAKGNWGHIKCHTP